jgi:hypothetical protein
MKIYVNDPVIPYKSTEIGADRTKMQIDGILGQWGIHRILWDWQPQNNVATLMFELPETFGESSHVSIRMEPPRVWKKASRKNGYKETVDWNVSMRCLLWYLKTSLEYAYLNQFDKATALLPFILGSDGKHTLSQIIIPRLDKVSQFEALPDEREEQRQYEKVVDVEGEPKS